MLHSSEMPQVTDLLIGLGRGDKTVLDELLPAVYGELRKLAAYHLSKERPDHTLQATALVHEAYVRLVDQQQVDWKNRAQFFGIASEMMRRILVNYARDRVAQKRGGGAQRVSLSVAEEAFEQTDTEMLALDDALQKLSAHDERKSKIVELKYFGGMTTAEIAEVLRISNTTVEREWTLARAWLYRKVKGLKG